MRLFVHTVRLSFMTLAGTCAFCFFSDSGPNYIHFQNYKNGAHSKVVLLKARTSIMLSTIVKKRRARRAAKRRAIWVREWINKNRSKLKCLPRITKKSLKTNTESHSGFFLRMNKALKHVDKSRTHPGKHDASSQRCFKVGPSS